MEWIDGELVMNDHVFERGDLSRAAYKYMTQWVVDHWDENLTPDDHWTQAEAAWDSLSPEIQAQLFILSNKEVQNAEDIRLGLLATLASYQGLKVIKQLFADAIKCVKV